MVQSIKHLPCKRKDLSLIHIKLLAWWPGCLIPGLGAQTQEAPSRETAGQGRPH